MGFFKNKEIKTKGNKKDTISKKILTGINIIILSIFMFGAGITGILATTFVDVIKDSPVVDASKMNELMVQSSVILDRDGNTVEKIENLENRTLVELKDIPKHLIDAFVSIEDERFYKHNGVDPIGISKSFIDTVFLGRVRGGSTIAQQLAKNMYLSSERKIERKLKEAYLALKITDSIKRDGVLEAYLNRVFLGQHAYGVQAASQVYFSKDVKDLTIPESALLAAIVQSPTNFSLYKTIKPENVSEDSVVISDLSISGQVYKAVYNPKVLDRQKYVLKKMYELKKITKEEYEQAVSYDVLESIKPNKGFERSVSTYFTELVKTQVAEKLMNKYNYSKEEAWDKIYNGGLTIHSTMDQNVQKSIEDIYENLANVLNMPKYGNTPSYAGWTRDNYGNILSKNKNIIYYAKNNLLTSENEIIIPNGEYSVSEDGSLNIQSDRISIYENVITPANFYTVNENNNLVTHGIGNFAVSDDLAKVDNAHSFTLSSELLKSYQDFYKIDDNNNLCLNSKYFQIDEEGTLQPQSSSVVIDHTTGQIIAIVGGRETKGNPVNRAYRIPRQPGSTIKPLAVYIPALDNGYTAATAIDDVPHYNEKHELWPKNWYNGYRGLQSLRNSVVQSINVNSVKTLEKIGIEKSEEYLTKFNIINKSNPLADTFISKSENIDANDENLASLALGAMTKGVTNLKMTAAFSAIANKGTYIEPISFTKVTDSTGKVVLQAKQDTQKVTSVENAFIMQSILSDVPKVLVPQTKIKDIDTAGKTGTTENVQDSWFIGFSPYYTVGTWVGFDNVNIKINQDINLGATLWGVINKTILKDKEAKKFDNPPSDIIQKYVSAKTGLLMAPGVKGGINEYFVKGTEPKDFDKSSVTVKIDKRNGKLATDSTPEEFIEERTYFVRPGGFVPGSDGILPEDYNSEKPPTEQSDINDDDEDDDDSEREKEKEREKKEKEKKKERDKKEKEKKKEKDKKNKNN